MGSRDVNDIVFIINEGTTDLYLTFDTTTVTTTAGNGLNGVIRLDGGESITDFRRTCKKINLIRATGYRNSAFYGGVGYGIE